eukprot:11208332-Alexandrium_andersonii.AAC.1
MEGWLCSRRRLGIANQCQCTARDVKAPKPVLEGPTGRGSATATKEEAVGDADAVVTFVPEPCGGGKKKLPIVLFVI